MILVEFTAPGHDMVRCALDDYALEHQWFSYIKSIDTIKYQLTKRHGGYFGPEVAQINFSPELFVLLGEYPPVVTMLITKTDSDGSSGTVIHDGNAFLDVFDRSSITYDISKPPVDVTITSGTSYSGTLNSVVTTLCGPTFMNLSVDLSLARGVSPAVQFTTDADQKVDELLSDMCAWFCHGYRIADGTLYLIDVLGSYSPTEVTEFDVQPCSYRKEKSYSLFKCGDNSIDGSNPVGSEEYDVGKEFHPTTANIEQALTDIRALMESSTAVISSKMDQINVGIADTITFYDESMRVPTFTTGIVSSIIYSPDDNKVELEVIGIVET